MEDEEVKASVPTDRRRFWSEHIQRQTGSGLGVAEYCRMNQLNKSAFFMWRAKLTGPAKTASGLVEVRPPRRLDGAGFVLHLPDGIRLEVHAPVDELALAKILKGLGLVR